MVEKEQGQFQFLISDFNARLVDLEERNRITRERVLLLGKNLVSIREESLSDIDLIKKDVLQNKQDIEKPSFIEQYKFCRKNRYLFIF